LYARARRGEISQFTGISSPYEAPEAAELVLATADMNVEACVTRVIDALTPLIRLKG
jgi:adenylylsulfate kinase-like enzyme